jgi:hypothetical protein
MVGKQEIAPVWERKVGLRQPILHFPLMGRRACPTGSWLNAAFTTALWPANLSIGDFPAT